MKKNRLLNLVLTTASMFVLTVAAVAASAPCVVVFYQPKAPKDAARRVKEIITGN